MSPPGILISLSNMWTLGSRHLPPCHTLRTQAYLLVYHVQLHVLLLVSPWLQAYLLVYQVQLHVLLLVSPWRQAS